VSSCNRATYKMPRQRRRLLQFKPNKLDAFTLILRK
jgi:hypothetical protein